ncbi:MAG: MotA/TolQ/ExbB proton channel family protein [Myxococcota bacterium]|jgi:biopolymer transport protein TolQ|nr:MotA/TolQ/ExbB proton channel family protein [Myxococcota bacterium]MDP6243366.1 MotA/TolQ/ExbB proton channel family protein [Myxococcota bacterium]MDP7076349.1 MotA/TolQ/ExbB proton channel family protein [Myxococcota bacterium]MDP7299979.1 MotA/TolQ/ExbB proton channel family protein [Myxococcota bacterium]MDP7432724.1 MotA/TolQ/ExbB proton channel family protein [Myxococcota bacterium]
MITAAASGGRLASLDAMSLIWQASWLVQLVLLFLVLMSVVSWAIILVKWRALRRAEQDSEAFLEVYQEGSLDAAYQLARELDRSPLAGVFLAGYSELSRMSRLSDAGLSDAQRRSLVRQIGWSASREGLSLERGLSFLATTGSAAPFIGLFGTVIGIIDAFQGIARTGSASLAVVAPGIAEALIATAVGLLAAIPATIFYNHFVGELRGLTAAIDLFSADCEGDLLKHGAGAGGPASAPSG